MRTLIRGQYTLRDALAAVRTQLTAGHQLAMLPALEAATDAWTINLNQDGRGTAYLNMQLHPLGAILAMWVTRAGRVKGVSTSRREDGTQVLSLDAWDCTWPEPVPPPPDWPVVAARWVTARNAEVPDDAVIRHRIKQLATELGETRHRVGHYRQEAARCEARATELADQIRELKDRLPVEELKP